MNKLLENIKYNKNYINVIKETKYSQKLKNNNTERYEKIEDLIIYTFDVDSVLEKNNKLYINNKKIELASKLSDTTNNYELFNYSKHFKNH